MSKTNRFARGQDYYKRKKVKNPPSGHCFLLVTEGEKTEPNYFNALRDKLRLSSVDVEIVHPNGTDPITLTNHAIELRNSRKKAAKLGECVPYDEVWVIFDLEKKHDIRRKQAKEATQIADLDNIHFARSDPSFEYWLILHYEYTTTPLANADEAIKRLRSKWPEYKKCCTPTDELFYKSGEASKRAMQCRGYHERAGGDWNPFTEIDQIVNQLNKATRSHYRLFTL